MSETTQHTSATDRFEEALARRSEQQYVLRLYVVGATPASQRAIANITRVCEEHLAGRYTLEVIDLYQRPELAAGEQILAAPTLVRVLPEPLARVVGDMSDATKMLVGLDLVQPDSDG
jgi:circadian clock protein KaiB